MKMMYLSRCLNIGRSTCKQPWEEGVYLEGRRNKGEEEKGGGRVPGGEEGGEVEKGQVEVWAATKEE